MGQFWALKDDRAGFKRENTRIQFPSAQRSEAFRLQQGSWADRAPTVKGHVATTNQCGAVFLRVMVRPYVMTKSPVPSFFDTGVHAIPISDVFHCLNTLSLTEQHHNKPMRGIWRGPRARRLGGGPWGDACGRQQGLGRSSAIYVMVRFQSWGYTGVTFQVVRRSATFGP